MDAPQLKMMVSLVLLKVSTVKDLTFLGVEITERHGSVCMSDGNSNNLAYAREQEYGAGEILEEEIDDNSSFGQQVNSNEHDQPSPSDHQNHQAYRVSKARNARDAPRKVTPTPSASAPGQESSFRGGRTGMIYSVNKDLRPSRYSGANDIPYYTNRDPIMVPVSEVSNASMIKRGTKPTSTGHVAKRAYGVTDPENLEIVRMKEEELLTFKEIAKRLNAERVRKGHAAGLTACGVTSRYARCAPVIFAANGIEFVALSERGGRNKPNPIKRDSRVAWDPKMLEELARIEKEFMATKWDVVASRFNDSMNTNITADEAATRHAHI